MRLYICFFVLQMLLGDTLSVMGTVTSVQQLSLQQKRELLDTHNYLRSIVSPTATNMQRMVGMLFSAHHSFCFCTVEALHCCFVYLLFDVEVERGTSKSGSGLCRRVQFCAQSSSQ